MMGYTHKARDGCREEAKGSGPNQLLKRKRKEVRNHRGRTNLEEKKNSLDKSKDNKKSNGPNECITILECEMGRKVYVWKTTSDENLIAERVLASQTYCCYA